MFQINLIPDSYKHVVKSRRQKWLFFTITTIGVAIVGALVILLAIRVFVFQKSRISSLEDGIESAKERIDSVEDLDRMVTISSNMQSVGPLLDDRPSVQRLEAFLEQILPPKVALEGYTLEYTEGGEAALSEPSLGAFSRPGLEYSISLTLSGGSNTPKSVNVLADTLKHTDFDYQDGLDKEDRSEKYRTFGTVTVESMSETKDSKEELGQVSFEIRATMDIETLNPALKDVRMSVPSIISSPSSSETPCIFNDDCKQEGAQ